MQKTVRLLYDLLYIWHDSRSIIVHAASDYSYEVRVLYRCYDRILNSTGFEAGRRLRSRLTCYTTTKISWPALKPTVN